MSLRNKMKKKARATGQKLRAKGALAEFEKQMAELPKLSNVLPIEDMTKMLKQARNAHKKDDRIVDAPEYPHIHRKHVFYREIWRMTRLSEILQEFLERPQQPDNPEWVVWYKSEWRRVRMALVRHQTQQEYVEAVRNYKRTGHILKAK